MAEVVKLFNIGDLIIYGDEGVCRVEEISVPDLPDVSPDRLYYTLSPLYREGRIYIPVDTAVFMRPVISQSEADELIGQIPEIGPCPCGDKSLRALSEYYEEFLSSHSCADLIQLILTIYDKEQAVAGSRKKLGLIDERYMKRAEEMLHGEFAVALGLDRDEVKEHIETQLRKRGQQQAI